MAVKAGSSYPLNVHDILKINSPTKHVDGPYVVVYIDTAERWAIVALSYGGNPRLGIRWFSSTCGVPQSSAISTWFIIPPVLNIAILNSLGLSPNDNATLNNFLNGNINGDVLKQTGVKSIIK
jgi:hypothetical protein